MVKEFENKLNVIDLGLSTFCSLHQSVGYLIFNAFGGFYHQFSLVLQTKYAVKVFQNKKKEFLSEAAETSGCFPMEIVFFNLVLKYHVLRNNNKTQKSEMSALFAFLLHILNLVSNLLML